MSPLQSPLRHLRGASQALIKTQHRRKLQKSSIPPILKSKVSSEIGGIAKNSGFLLFADMRELSRLCPNMWCKASLTPRIGAQPTILCNSSLMPTNRRNPEFFAIPPISLEAFDFKIGGNDDFCNFLLC